VRMGAVVACLTIKEQAKPDGLTRSFWTGL